LGGSRSGPGVARGKLSTVIDERPVAESGRVERRGESCCCDRVVYDEVVGLRRSTEGAMRKSTRIGWRSGFLTASGHSYVPGSVEKLVL